MTDPFLEINELEQLGGEQRSMRSSFLAKAEMVFRLYIYAGLLVAILGLGFFAFSFLDIKLTVEQRLSLLIAGGGFAISIMSAAYLGFMRQREVLRSEEYQLITMDMDLIREWAKFEAAGRRLLEEQGAAYNSRSPRAILVALEENSTITPDVAREIRLALDVRNRVVHEAKPVDQRVVHAAANLLANANAKLNEAISLSGREDDGERRPRALNLEGDT